jgi:hypothetical protein
VRIVVGESEVDFDFVPEPEKVQQLILQRVEEYERLQKIEIGQTTIFYS